MSSSKKQQKPQLPNKVIDLLVSDILKKNNINPEQVKKNVTEEQKEMIRELVQDLSQQVDQFVKQSESKTSEGSKGSKEKESKESKEKAKKKFNKKVRFKK